MSENWIIKLVTKDIDVANEFVSGIVINNAKYNDFDLK